MKTKTLTIEYPAEYREGQALMNFLDWIKFYHHYDDVFHISDDILNQLKKDWNGKVEPISPS